MIVEVTGQQYTAIGTADQHGQLLAELLKQARRDHPGKLYRARVEIEPERRS